MPKFHALSGFILAKKHYAPTLGKDGAPVTPATEPYDLDDGPGVKSLVEAGVLIKPRSAKATEAAEAAAAAVEAEELAAERAAKLSKQAQDHKGQQGGGHKG